MNALLTPYTTLHTHNECNNKQEVYADGTPVEDTMPITSEDSGDNFEFEILLKPGADRLGIRLRDMQGGGALVIGFSTQDSAAEVRLHHYR
jgi:hypothetical protein